MMIPMEVIHKVGMMAEIYFLYYEELDWGARIRAAGYDLWYVHNSCILHKESISTGKLTPFKTYYMNRSRLLYLRRNVNGFAYLIAVLYQIFVSIPKNIIVFLLRQQTGHLKAYIRAIFWHIKHLSTTETQSSPEL